MFSPCGQAADSVAAPNNVWSVKMAAITQAVVKILSAKLFSIMRRDENKCKVKKICRSAQEVSAFLIFLIKCLQRKKALYSHRERAASG